ncbi:hypothetical protein JG688_00016099 [Phytophthora aleatoria]|uniref:Uncharacterized protein n=1 Tax=Phytophthora aleatoria TaxID=2496075 RepID=A0A8J5I8Y7_9STRA|nr:hypothetical protein JG688_00016099 [Phytophthora aleatoria]
MRSVEAAGFPRTHRNGSLLNTTFTVPSSARNGRSIRKRARTRRTCSTFRF